MAKKCTITKMPTRFCVDLSEIYLHDLHGRLRKPRNRTKPEKNLVTITDPTNEDLMFIAWQHSVDQIGFGNMVGEFFFPNAVPPAKMETLPSIQSLMSQAGDSGSFIFNYDDSDTSSNEMDIIPNSKPHSAKKNVRKRAKALATVQYSVYLFKGILLLAPLVTKFHFYKAIDNGEKTVVIVGLDNNNLVRYMGELSEFYPIENQVK